MALADDIMNAVFNGTNYTSPTELYLALYTQAGEVIGGSYQRVNVTGKFSQSSQGTVFNQTQIVFPEATLDWGLITRAVLFDAQTAGNELISFIPKQSFSVVTGNEFYLNTNTLQAGVSF